jgi:ABC-type phosphate transport system substrate-binding protein
MRSLSARRILPACILSAATVAALAAPGAASASLGTQCSGVSITAQGSSLQKIAQQNVWTPGFNTSTNKLACNGSQGSKGKPTVTYTSTGSGAGLKSWGAEPKEAKEVVFGPTNAFVGTDEPPSASQIAEIESHETTLTPEALETIPVVQESVAVIVNLPSNCTATSTSNPGRLVLNNSTLQGIYSGTIKKWSEIADGGDSITGAGCNTASTITPVARFDQSGTTHVFKRYLGLINPGTLVTEAETSETWNDLSEGSQNVVWPKAAGVVKPAAKGGGEVLAKVAATAGSIGYVNIAEARTNAAFVPPAGGANKATFWAPLQNSQKGKAPKLKFTYADPATNGEVSAAASANCNKTAYTNGSNPFPPPAVTAPWNEVTTKTTEKAYTLCGLTFDLAFTSFSSFPGTSQAQATTVGNYLRFVLETKTGGGQKLIGENHDYLALPKGAVLTDATNGAKNIGF